MKSQIKLFICIISFTCFYSNTSGQGFRHADLKVKFVTPDSNAVFASPTDISFTFRVYNQGPDTIWPNDSLTFKPSHTLVNYSKTETVAWGKMVAKGDSMDFSSSVYVNYSKDLNNFQLFFSEIPLAFGFTKDKGTLYSETNETQKDNNDVVTFKLLGSSSVSEEKLLGINVYPNPVSNQVLNINGITNITNVKLYNSSMQVVQEIVRPNLIGQTTTIPINRLTNGMYLVSITTSSESIMKQIVVNH